MLQVMYSSTCWFHNFLVGHRWQLETICPIVCQSFRRALEPLEFLLCTVLPTSCAPAVCGHNTHVGWG